MFFVRSKIAGLFYLLVETPLSWAAVIMLSTMWFFQRNSLSVSSELHETKQMRLIDELAELEKKNLLLSKKVKKLETAISS